MGESLFKRLCTAHPQSTANLTYQYRMNAAIMSIPNTLVYGGLLQCGSPAVAQATLDVPCWDSVVNQRPPFQGLPPWMRHVMDPAQTVVFLNTDAIGAVTERGPGGAVFNPLEVHLMVQMVSMFQEAGVASDSIGIICPFNLQIAHLREALPPTQAVDVLTIDKSQGRDKELVLLSLVHSNTDSHIGEIMRDLSRLNVAFSRAKHKLVVLGSQRTYAPHPPWSDLLQLLHSNSWVYDLPSDADQWPMRL